MLDSLLFIWPKRFSNTKEKLGTKKNKVALKVMTTDAAARRAKKVQKEHEEKKQQKNR